MKHRNRLKSYKKNAALGKLDQLLNENQTLNQNQPNKESVENIRKDSALMERDIASLLAVVFANDADGFLDPPNGFAPCFVVFSDGLGRFKPRTKKWLIDQMEKKGKHHFIEMISEDTDRLIKKWRDMFNDTNAS